MVRLKRSVSLIPLHCATGAIIGFTEQFLSEKEEDLLLVELKSRLIKNNTNTGMV